MPRGVAAVLLDYGGTLDGDALHWFDHFVALYRRAGIGLPLAALKSAFYAADEELGHDPAVTRYALEPMVREHVRLQLAHLALAEAALATTLVDAFVGDTRRAWDRNRPMLRRLATRFRLGVVSNAYGNMLALLAEADLAPFAVILDSALIGIRKPDPALYALAARQLDLPPAAVLHVGDSWERDVVPAHSAGMQVAWLARPEARMPGAPAPVWRMTTLLELEALLR